MPYCGAVHHLHAFSILQQNEFLIGPETRRREEREEEVTLSLSFLFSFFFSSPFPRMRASMSCCGRLGVTLTASVALHGCRRNNNRTLWLLLFSSHLRSLLVGVDPFDGNAVSSSARAFRAATDVEGDSNHVGRGEVCAS